MKKQRLISILLVLAMLTSSVAMSSCSDSTDTSKEGETAAETTGDTETAGETAGEAAPVETEPEKDSLQARLDVSDELPETTFNGDSFAMIIDNGYEQFYLADEVTGEVVNDAVYNRNANVSERFDVELIPVFQDEGNLVTEVKQTVNAGDDSYQLVSGHAINLGQAVRNNYMYNWNDLPHIDFNQPWWSDSTVEDLTVNGKTYLAVGDMAVSAISSTNCMLFNKDMVTEYNLPSIYDIVKEGAWTLDKLYELSQGIYKDENGDGLGDENDTWGFASESMDATNAYLWAFGKKIVTTGADGKLTMDGFYDEKYVSIIERLYDLFVDSGLTYTETGVWNVGRDTFKLGNTLFANINLGQTTALRDSELEYGIIPYPKWDENQAEYATNVTGGHEAMAILTSIQKPEMVGVIAEALCAESWKHIIPAYYDTTIKYKGARDEESIAMLDMIVDSRVFDFGYVYGGFGCAFWIQDCINGKTKDIASIHKKESKILDKSMKKVFEYFEEEQE